LKNKPIARKSLVAKKSINKGEIFSSENLTTKRPGIGLEPIKYWNLLGEPSDRNYEKDSLIE
jgi:N-acetylneuraminate synthase